MKGKDSNRTQIYEKSRRTLSSIRAAASELKLSDILPGGAFHSTFKNFELANKKNFNILNF